MCDICRRTPCHPRCPNAAVKETAKVCVYCNQPIIAGDSYYESSVGKCVHEDCASDLLFEEVLRFCGEEIELITVEDDDF